MSTQNTAENVNLPSEAQQLHQDESDRHQSNKDISLQEGSENED